MEQTEQSLYALLIGISRDVGEIKADVKNVQNKVETYNEASTVADEKAANKLEEYFEYAKNRQDSIKAELETKIGNVRSSVSDMEIRIHTLEEKPKNKLWSIFEKFNSLLIAAILTLLVGGCMKFMADIAKSVRQPEIPHLELPRDKV